MKAGTRVKVTDKAARQFRASYTRGRVVRVRRDGQVVVKWDALFSEQVWSPKLLEVIEE